MNLKEKKIYVAGANGMAGGAIVRNLRSQGYQNLLAPSSSELDLRNQFAVEKFFDQERPEIVILAAAKVGGVWANNTFRADFIYENLMIEANVIHSSFVNKVEKLIFLSSAAVYPNTNVQPIKEETILSGFPDSSNEPYAVAKIAGIKLCESFYRQYGCDFYALTPTNLYGANDNYHPQNSHVIPALIRKFHEAKSAAREKVVLWGTGKPCREFLYVEDLADATIFAMENIDAKDLDARGIAHINVGTGEDITISEAAEKIKKIVGFAGAIEYDATKPDGTPRKLLDVSRMKDFGWKSSTTFDDGLRKTYEWFVNNLQNLKNK